MHKCIATRAKNACCQPHIWSVMYHSLLQPRIQNEFYQHGLFTGHVLCSHALPIYTMPNHGVFPLHTLVTFSKCNISQSLPPPTKLSSNSPSQNSIGQQPLGALPSPQIIPPTLNLLPPPPSLIQSTSHNVSQLISNTSTAANISSQHMVDHGLPPVSKKLADQICAGEFIDVAELPPAKGKVRPIQSPEGGVLLVNAHDLLQQKRLIPDLATWVQCFSLYTVIICSQSPECITDLLGYMCQIVRASHRFKWPSWVIYDQNFRQEAAEHNQTSD